MKAHFKLITMIISMAVVCPLFSIAADLSSLDSTIQIVQEQIDRQMERIQAARLKTDNQMSLARARVEQQLEAAQGELALQVEKLQRLRAQLQDKARETEEKIAYWQTQGTTIVSKTLSEVARQINETTNLIEQLDRLKTEVNCNCPDRNTSSRRVPSPQSSNHSFPESSVTDADTPPMQNVAMLSFPDAEPLTFLAPPVVTTG